jgi:hypothetical protein
LRLNMLHRRSTRRQWQSLWQQIGRQMTMKVQPQIVFIVVVLPPSNSLQPLSSRQPSDTSVVCCQRTMQHYLTLSDHHILQVLSFREHSGFLCSHSFSFSFLILFSLSPSTTTSFLLITHSLPPLSSSPSSSIATVCSRPQHQDRNDALLISAAKLVRPLLIIFHTVVTACAGAAAYSCPQHAHIPALVCCEPQVR